MWRDGEAAVLVNQRTNIARGPSLQPRRLGQGCPDAKQMTFGGGDFNFWNNEKTLHWQSILAHQFFTEQIIDSVARIVISNGNAMQSFCPFVGNQIFLARHVVTGRKGGGVGVSIVTQRVNSLIW